MGVADGSENNLTKSRTVREIERLPHVIGGAEAIPLSVYDCRHERIHQEIGPPGRINAE
jgi:hypothetical protein